MASITELKAELVQVKAAIASVLENGKNYNINGSHSSEAADLKDLRTQQVVIERKLLISQGYTGRTYATFSGGN